jgi:mono/diheme cytochrome c family protein
MWLAQQIRDPQSHDPQAAMPSFSQLSDEQVNQLVAYLESLGTGSSASGSPSGPSRQGQEQSTPPTPATSSTEPSSSQGSEPNAPATIAEPNVPATGQQGPPGRAAYLVGQTIHGIGTLGAPMHGQLLYDKWCQRCHGQDGKDNVSNPGSDDGTVPPLNPIDRELYSDNPVTFAENIDRYIQHGSMPAGPHPEQHMPAWGDDLKLTQEMISEIEAYVLRLNGVDRAKIMTPGVRPWVFFLICLIAFTLAISARGMYLGNTDESPTEMPDDGETRPTLTEEPKPGVNTSADAGTDPPESRDRSA